MVRKTWIVLLLTRLWMTSAPMRLLDTASLSMSSKKISPGALNCWRTMSCIRRYELETSRWSSGRLRGSLRAGLKAPAIGLQRHSQRHCCRRAIQNLENSSQRRSRKLNLRGVRQFQEATIRPDLTTIVVVGDVSADEARTVIEKWFGGWKAVGPTPNTILPPVPLNKASSVHIPDPGATQDSVIIAEQLDLNRFDPDYYPLQLGNTILGGNSEGTRLYQDLRQVSGYVYNVDLDLDASETRAVYSISYGSAQENTWKARALIQRDIEQMRSGEVSPDELHQAKAFLLRQIPLSASSEEEVAEDLLDRAETGLPLDEPIREVRKYLDVNASEIRAAFAKRIRPDDFVQVVRGPSF